MTEEVSNPHGLSGPSAGDPAMLAASQQAMWLKDKDVVDVNGQKMGKIVRAFAEAGTLTRFDVRLTNQAKQILGVDPTRTLADVPGAYIQRVEGDQVRLNQAAEAILRPEDPTPLHAEHDERGAPELPRKER